MPTLIALDVAVLPPPDASARAVRASAALPRHAGHDLRLGADYLPHITLTQQFVRMDELEAALDEVASVLKDQPPLTCSVTGGGRGASAVWMAVRRTPELVGLHERLITALTRYEQSGGGTAAFVDAAARPGDVAWVTTYRRQASFAAFRPHITLGYAKTPPHVEPFTFDATTIAACHLGRFCSCRRVLRSWELA